MLPTTVVRHDQSVQAMLHGDLSIFWIDDTFDDQVALATDSIVQRQLEEEARLRARLPQTDRQ